MTTSTPNKLYYLEVYSRNQNVQPDELTPPPSDYEIIHSLDEFLDYLFNVLEECLECTSDWDKSSLKFYNDVMDNLRMGDYSVEEDHESITINTYIFTDYSSIM